jgi:hypothetical protein
MIAKRSGIEQILLALPPGPVREASLCVRRFGKDWRAGYRFRIGVVIYVEPNQFGECCTSRDNALYLACNALIHRLQKREAEAKAIGCWPTVKTADGRTAETSIDDLVYQRIEEFRDKLDFHPRGNGGLSTAVRARETKQSRRHAPARTNPPKEHTMSVSTAKNDPGLQASAILREIESRQWELDEESQKADEAVEQAERVLQAAKENQRLVLAKLARLKAALSDPVMFSQPHDQRLKAALAQAKGAQWEKLVKDGADDAAILVAIGKGWPDYQTSAPSDRDLKFKGGKKPAVWIDAAEAWKARPTFEGQKLAGEIRRIKQIPAPKSEATRAKAAAKKSAAKARSRPSLIKAAAAKPSYSTWLGQVQTLARVAGVAIDTSDPVQADLHWRNAYELGDAPQAALNEFRAKTTAESRKQKEVEMANAEPQQARRDGEADAVPIRTIQIAGIKRPDEAMIIVEGAAARAKAKRGKSGVQPVNPTPPDNIAPGFRPQTWGQWLATFRGICKPEQRKLLDEAAHELMAKAGELFSAGKSPSEARNLLAAEFSAPKANGPKANAPKANGPVDPAAVAATAGALIGGAA